MRDECLELQKKYKKNKVRRPKVMVATWSDEESNFSLGNEDQVANICLMAHEDDLSKINYEIDSITIEQWEVLYENIYTKYKKLKYENKSLKIKIVDYDNLEAQSKRVECILAENDLLKSENENLVNKIAMLD